MLNLLYLSCHEILEYYDVSNLRAIGHNIFCVGYHLFPSIFKQISPNDPELQKIFNRYHEYKTPGPIAIDKRFLKKFDLVINAHYPENFTWNWDKFTQPVVYRSISSCLKEYEQFYSQYKGIKIVRLSPKERTVEGFLGEDAVIRGGVEEAPEWIGNQQNLLTVQKLIHLEPSRMLSEYEQITFPFKKERILVGKDNKVNYSISVDWKELEQLRQNCRAYLSLCSRPAPLVYSFAEALMAGLPVVMPGKKLIGYNWEQPDLVEHGVSGFYSDSISEIQDIIRQLFNNYDLAKSVSIEAKKVAQKEFGLDKIREKWKQFLNQM